MDIGATLQEARKKRGLSLETISLKTKISIDLLHAIEGNAFERMPAGVFVRGFLRAYAHELGLNPEQIVAEYQANMKRNGDTAGVEPDSPIPPEAASPESSRQTVDMRALVIRPWPIAALLVAAVGIYLFARSTGRQAAPDELPGATAAAARPAASPPVTQAPPAPVPVATAGKPLQISLEASRPCWVSATADGQRVVYKTLQKGERQTIAVQDVLSLRLGDAGALTSSIDGVPGRPFGASGQPITIQITRGNFRDFLARNAP